MEDQKLGYTISQLRKKKHMTQKELAEKLFVTDKAVSKWERNVGRPDISILPDLAKALGVTIDILLSDEISNEVDLSNIKKPDTGDSIYKSDSKKTIIDSTDAKRDDQLTPEIFVSSHLQTSKITAFHHETSNKGTSWKVFLNKRHIRLFRMLPIIWSCLFGCMTIFYLISEILAMFVSESQMFSHDDLSIISITIFSIFSACLILSMITGWIPIIICYFWEKLLR